MAKLNFGWKRDRVDDRDYHFSAVRPTAALPASVDLRSQCSPIRDQGDLGSCTGFAVTALREFMENAPIPTPTPDPVPTPDPEPTPDPTPVPVPPVSKETLDQAIAFLQWAESVLYPVKQAVKRISSLTILSPLFLYYEERVLEGAVYEDAGAEIRDGMKVLSQTGCSPEVDAPYNTNNFTRKPSATALADAAGFKITSYHRCDTLADIKTAVAGGYGVVLGFDVYESFMTDQVAETGVMPMPTAYEQCVGGHAVFVCGYKSDPAYSGGGYLIIKNSWSTDWGDKGYFYMPYAYVTSEYVGDNWTAIA